MKIVVTGANGFIGSHLVDRLLIDGHVVIAIDKVFEGSNLAIKHDRLIKFISDMTTWPESMNFEKLSLLSDADIFFHLAAEVNLTICESDPKFSHDINVTATLTALELCKKLGIKKFVFASSAAVYGDSHFSFTEKANCEPVNIYGVQKLSSELYCNAFREFMTVNIFRFFNVFGPRQKNGVISLLCKAEINEMPFVMYGSPKSFRDYIYIDDVISALIHGMSLDLKAPVNVASGVKRTIEDIVLRFRPKSVVNRPGRKGEVFGCAGSVDRMLNLMSGFYPKTRVNFDFCINETIEYWRYELSETFLPSPDSPSIDKDQNTSNQG